MTQAKQTITVRSHVGRDGILHLDVPVELREVELEVTVTVQPIKGEPEENSPETLGWSPGFFEETFGAWEGEPLTRAPQPAVSPAALGWPEGVLRRTAGSMPELERPPQGEDEQPDALDRPDSPPSQQT